LYRAGKEANDGSSQPSPTALFLMHPLCTPYAPYVLRGTPKCSSEHIGSKAVAKRERVGEKSPATPEDLQDLRDALKQKQEGAMLRDDCNVEQ
jgi:hypothetical protein